MGGIYQDVINPVMFGFSKSGVGSSGSTGGSGNSVVGPGEAVKLAVSKSAVATIRTTFPRLDQTRYAGNDFDYWPECGLRNAYYHVKSIVSWELIEELYGKPVFISGPHEPGNPNFRSKDSFGHYDPDFFKWCDLQFNAAFQDAAFVEVVKPLYEKYLDQTSRTYLAVYYFLSNRPEILKGIKEDYLARMKAGTLGEGFVSDLTFIESDEEKEENGEVREIDWEKVEWEKLDEKEAKLLRAMQQIQPLMEGLRNRRDASTQYAFTDPSARNQLGELCDLYDSNIVAPAVYFFVRRSIDGTFADAGNFCESIVDRLNSTGTSNIISAIASIRYEPPRKPEPISGIGAVMQADRDGALVIQVVEGGPASTAGIQKGDRIISVDGNPLEGIAIDDIVKRVRGAPGSSVEIELLRDGGIHRKLKLQRAQIRPLLEDEGK